MKRLLPALVLAGALPAWAQSMPAPSEDSTPDAKPAFAPATNSAPDAPAPSAKPASAKATRTVELQATVDRLTRNNQELLDLLKEQQSVLKDIQVDRRLLNRQVALLEQRLEDTLQTNATLQAQVSKLQAEAVAAQKEKPVVASDAIPSKPEATPIKGETPAEKTNAPAAALATPGQPPPPVSFLPAESTGGAPGTMWWHRLMSISGDDSEDSKTFHITGKTWRVLWHNQDKPGAAYKNTSALFISAFPANDSIPHKVSSKLGSGGDSTEMTGTGDFYLRIEASGGHWEMAVEDFR